MPLLSHLPELLVVMVVALLIFGPKRLPEIGNSVGKTIKEFRKTMSEPTTPENIAAPTTPQIPPMSATSSAAIDVPTPETANK